jgi:hypothetical protein
LENALRSITWRWGRGDKTDCRLTRSLASSSANTKPPVQQQPEIYDREHDEHEEQGNDAKLDQGLASRPVPRHNDEPVS